MILLLSVLAEGPEQPVGRVVFFDVKDGTYCFSNFTSRLRVLDKNIILMDVLFSRGTKGEPRKQTAIGEISESWNVVQLKQIADLRRENVKPEDNPNLNFVGLEHIDSGESILKRWGDASAMKSAKNRFYPDDVLYGKLRSYLDKSVITIL